VSQRADRPDVSILIVAYNSRAVIAACLRSIPASITRHSSEILLIDNGDGTTADLVAREFPDVLIVPSRGNVGFATGNNLLAGKARGRHLLLLNPDVVLKPAAVDRLLDATRAYPDAAAWGGVTLDEKDRPDLGNTVHVPSLREMASRTLGRSIAARGAQIALEEDTEVAALSGSFVMFARDAWDEVGGLDDRYFLYCEEVDLFYRLAKRGYSFWRIVEARGFHDIGHGGTWSTTRMLYRAAGNMQFVRTHWRRHAQLCAFVLVWLGAWQRLVAGRLLGRWKPRMKIVGESYRDMALKPNYWRYGYDPELGLQARLGN